MFEFLRYGLDVGTASRDGAELVIDPNGPGPAATFRIEDEDFNERSLKASAALRGAEAVHRRRRASSTSCSGAPVEA